MKKTTIAIVMAALCLNFSGKAQALHNKIQPIKIGDAIPQALWDMPLQVVNHPEGKKTIRLQEFRHKKLIILDFWATSCKPCIKSLHKLDSLQQVYKDDLAVVPILVYDLEKNALPFMLKRSWKLPTVVGDTTFNKQLFVRYMTGFGNVWIVAGKLYAIPRPDNITTGNIAAVIAGTKISLQNIKQQF